MGEALGGGGRGNHQWWGGVRRSRKRDSSAGSRGMEDAVSRGRAAWGRAGGTGSISRDGGG
jgi:hypothetical protein